ncbi:MAG: 1-deoxy-D-xylulose-5-phosphate synthase [Candidatus Omnitrophica bacterium]|nr:1-deoxy-D-xylulose-5-phosphate synthase [Candidatus Omnitrophota bacterium]MBU1925023.1 1-deoxy-D-xylulose-5-phosphate synthase [Candidatus Omnitrophota bacterium]
MERILDRVNMPQDLKGLSADELRQLAIEIRQLIIDTVSKTGGHLASNLGTVELTIALHYCLNMPRDIILWDVGHQSYTHKILTGRKNRFHTLRQEEGISGFPDAAESPDFDFFTVGHSSTTISWALGLACARDISKQEPNKIAVVIGDASLANGMAFEALNHAGHLQKKLVIILNDNELSISPSIGGLSKYLNRIATSPIYNRIRRDVEKLLKYVPWFGFRALRAAKKLERALKNILVPGMFFEELGFRYFGPVNGDDIPTIIDILNRVTTLEEPVIIHLLTKKGKGYEHAEKFPSKFHSAGKFQVASGTMNCAATQNFTEVFGKKMLELAQKDERIVAITAAMPTGTGLEEFSQKFNKRFFDAGIAEEHAIGFAAGLSRGGLIPVVAIYSTFLQRGFDQIIHDVCLQKLHIIFALDRAGVVSDDGPTHNGVFDISYLRLIPNITVMAPADKDELEKMLEFAVSLRRPCAVRYPKDCIPAPEVLAGMEIMNRDAPITLGKSRVLRSGKDAVIFALGSMVYPALQAARILLKDDIYMEVIDARFAKPLDAELLKEKARHFKAIVTIEDGVASGGFGSGICEFIQNHCPREDTAGPMIKNLALPDKFLSHGKRDSILTRYGLDAAGIADSIKSFLSEVVYK